MGTSEKLARLMNLRNQCGEIVFERVKLSAEIIKDNEWIATIFKGNLNRAEKHLEEEYLGDLCGAISFRTLIGIIEEFPDIDRWTSYKFNLTALAAEVEKIRQTEKPKGTRNVVSQKMYSEIKDQLKQSEYHFKQEHKRTLSLQEENKQLKEQLTVVMKERADLQVRVAELEKLLFRRSA